MLMRSGRIRISLAFGEWMRMGNNESICKNMDMPVNGGIVE